MVREVVDHTIQAMRSQPLAIALVLINIAFLLGGVIVLRDIAKSVERRDDLIMNLASGNCEALKKGRE